MPFMSGLERSLPPPALGLQMLPSVREGNFELLIACLSPRQKGSAAVCSAEEPQGIPAEKIQAAGVNAVCAS